MSSGIAVPGTTVPASSLVGSGGAQGVQGASGPDAVSTDANNLATLGSDSKVLVPASSIWNIRLRSFNAVGNPTMECDQRLCGASKSFSPAISPPTIDRWFFSSAGTNWQVTIQQMTENIVVPGTNFLISSKFLRIQNNFRVALAQPTYTMTLSQVIEGPLLRELVNDVHSISLLVRTGAGVSNNFSFGLVLQDNVAGTPAYSLSKLCTVPTTGTWTLIPLPNLPIWPSAGTFPLTPGSGGYKLLIALIAGSNFLPPANDTWQSGNFSGAVGQNTFGNALVNTGTFDIGFVQHEPGPLCTTLIDKPFTQNYNECERYFCKSYEYLTAPGAVSSAGRISFFTTAAYLTNPAGHAKFPAAMAKAPTVNAYSDITGAINMVRDQVAPADRAVSTVLSSSKDIYQITTATGTTAASLVTFHYVADTGW